VRTATADDTGGQSESDGEPTGDESGAGSEENEA